jgi:hypothetical protein
MATLTYTITATETLLDAAISQDRVDALEATLLKILKETNITDGKVEIVATDVVKS